MGTKQSARTAAIPATALVAASIVAGAALARAAAQASPAGGAAQTAQTTPDVRQTPYPAQQRPPGDPALIARGQALYTVTCRSCHGVDLRGGDLGGPNLLRSQLVLRDQQGELMGPVILSGRSSPGMPTMPAQALSPDDVRAVAEYIHSIVASAERQGSPPKGAPVELNILVGDPVAGRAYFDARCSSCHSPTGDLQGLATRIGDPKDLQNRWVRGGPAPSADVARPPAMVTVTLPSGERVEGRLERLDDFFVGLTEAGGRRRSFGRRGDVPRVDVADPMAGHSELLSVYTDKDIHDVTAFLASLK